MLSSGTLHCVALVRTGVSEECSASIIRVTLMMEPHDVTTQKTEFFIVTPSENLKSYLDMTASSNIISVS
jgi:hypothetical protein